MLHDTMHDSYVRAIACTIHTICYLSIMVIWNTKRMVKYVPGRGWCCVDSIGHFDNYIWISINNNNNKNNKNNNNNNNPLSTIHCPHFMRWWGHAQGWSVPNGPSNLWTMVVALYYFSPLAPILLPPALYNQLTSVQSILQSSHVVMRSCPRVSWCSTLTLTPDREAGFPHTTTLYGSRRGQCTRYRGHYR